MTVSVPVPSGSDDQLDRRVEPARRQQDHDAEHPEEQSGEGPAGHPDRMADDRAGGEGISYGGPVLPSLRLVAVTLVAVAACTDDDDAAPTASRTAGPAGGQPAISARRPRRRRRRCHRRPRSTELTAGLLAADEVGVPSASWAIRDVDPAIMDADMTVLADPLQGLATCPDGALRPAAGWLQRTFSGAEPLDTGMLRVDLVLAVQDAAGFGAQRDALASCTAGEESVLEIAAGTVAPLDGTPLAPVGPAVEATTLAAVGRADGRRAVPEQLRAGDGEPRRADRHGGGRRRRPRCTVRGHDTGAGGALARTVVTIEQARESTRANHRPVHPIRRTVVATASPWRPSPARWRSAPSRPVPTRRASTSAAVVGTPWISMIGDSTLSGVRWTNNYWPLERFNYTFDAESCRRTIGPVVPRARGLRAADGAADDAAPARQPRPRRDHDDRLQRPGHRVRRGRRRDRRRGPAPGPACT